MLLSDVTLREGDQMPGRGYAAEEKVACARTLDDLGVPFIQPAFPATGEKDRSVVSELAGTTDADLVALARAMASDVDVAVDAGADVVETFVPISNRHLEHLLGKDREEALSMLIETVDHVVDRGAIPHITLADAFRTDIDDLRAVFEAVPDVPVVTLADSVGSRTPTSVSATLDALAADVDLSRVGVHFHDDLGCATANALAAYRAGAAKADVSVGGLGERAGNSALEEVVAACTVEHDDGLGLDTSDLVPSCRSVLDRLGETYDDRKALIGGATTEHESGIHTAAMLSDPATLEPFDPARFGGERRLVFGAPTGASGARKLLERAGIEADDERIRAFVAALSEQGPLDLEAALALASDEFGD